MRCLGLVLTFIVSLVILSGCRFAEPPETESLTPTPSDLPPQRAEVTPIRVVEILLQKAHFRDERRELVLQAELAELYYHLGDEARSLQLLRRLESQNPDEITLLAYTWGDLGYADELIRSTESDPRIALEYVAKFSGQTRTRLLRHAERAFKGDFRGAADLAKVYLKVGERERAAEMLEHCMRLDAPPPDSFYNVGPFADMIVVASKLGKTAEKEFLAQQVRTAIPLLEEWMRSPAWSRLARAFIAAGNEGEARQCLREAQKTDDPSVAKNSIGAHELGLAWAELGEQAEALKILGQVKDFKYRLVGIAPHIDDSEALFQIAKMIAQWQPPDRSSFSVYTYIELVECQVQMGRKDRAEELLSDLCRVIGTQTVETRLEEFQIVAAVAVKRSLEIEQEALQDVLRGTAPK